MQSPPGRHRRRPTVLTVRTVRRASRSAAERPFVAEGAPQRGGAEDAPSVQPGGANRSAGTRILSRGYIGQVEGDRPGRFNGDIKFVETPGGFEVWYSDRIVNDHRDLVDASADWLEDKIGVMNLGQINHQILIADGLITDKITTGLVAWWFERIGDLDVP